MIDNLCLAEELEIGSFIRIKETISDSGETYCYIGVVKSIDVDEDGLIELYTTYTYKGDLKIDKNSIWSDVLVEDGWTDPDTLLNNFGKMTEIEFSKKYPEYII